MALPKSSFEQAVSIESTRATFVVVTSDYTPYATATDMLMLQNPLTSGKILV